MGVLFDLMTEGFEPTSVIDSVNFEKLYAEAVDVLNEFASIFESTEDEGESIEIFSEATEGAGGIGEKIAKPLKRTKEQVGMAAKSYNDVTTGAGDMLHSSTKVTLRVASWISKVIGLICKFIGWIPEAIDALCRKIAKLSGKAWHRLTGKFDINVTIEDLNYWKKNILPKIDEFMGHCKIFANKKYDWVDGFGTHNVDFKRYKSMEAIMLKLRNVKVTPTALPIKSEFVRNTYFNQDSDYYKMIQEFNSYFTSKKRELEELQKNISEKRTDQQGSGAYFKLKPVHRAKVDNAERMVGQFLNIILKLYKNIQEDINVISNLANKINKDK